MLDKLIQQIRPTINPKISDAVSCHLDDLTKPKGSLGRLEEFVLQYCLCRQSREAAIRRPCILTFAADHGITEMGITPFPAEVTAQMVKNMAGGGAAVSVMATQAGYPFRVIDVGVKADLTGRDNLLIRKIRKGTRNFLKQPAMSREEVVRAIGIGIETVDAMDADLLGLGEMGIGNSSSASALYSLILGVDPVECVGPGTGSRGELLKKKIRCIEEAIGFHRNGWDATPLDALARVGGLEIAAIVGAILGACRKATPIVIDGFICSAAAIVAMQLSPLVHEYLFFSHVSDEPFHRKFMKSQRIKPVLDMGMRLGEGTGAVLAMQILQQALACYHQMATFSGASVSGRVDW